MLVGIDSYSFHRYFGEMYAEGLQIDPGTRWDMKDDFVPYAISLEVDEVALETIFFPVFDDTYCAAIKDRLDEAGLRRVIGWGHPDGLHRGQDEGALEDLIRHIPRAEKVGASIMRIVASSMLYVNEDHGPQIAASVKMLKKATRVAEDNGVTLAIENHIDFTSEEILDILDGVGSDNLKVNFDTGNALRLFEDPVEAARRLAPVTVATHTKDIISRRGGSPSDRFTFWPSCPAGEGLVDLLSVARVLDESGFTGSLAIELDLLASPWNQVPEEENVAQSIAYLKSIRAQIEAEKVSGGLCA
ncbi:sugar phosphate isomerase/epimerase [Cryobacterium glaciale]|uniref:Sugar phosphate isomerase/epimerase n=1 Tax=Cryobacterium glaciale TaxID=1259145 RepID=A0A4R8V2W3_9MICO|nr:sugar phosphate isomerase/epimerase family protein [Cryobacterium glaciale]TFB76678.1 sugar phosphate isomerase/epimerase [Cryobacterium glaciale]